MTACDAVAAKQSSAGRHLMQFLPILLGLLCILCYRAGISDFYIFDSRVWLERNPALIDMAPTFPAVYEAMWSSESGPLGRPLTMLSFAIESLLSGGLDPHISKLLNVLLHVGNGALLYAILRTLTRYSRLRDWPGVREMPQAFAGAVVALWLLHPLHVSTVLYDVQRMVLLSSTGVLTGLLVFVRWRAAGMRSDAAPPNAVRAAVMLCTLTMAAALAKENGILLPWFVALLELLCFGGIFTAAARSRVRAVCIVFLAVPAVTVLATLAWQPEFITRGFAYRDFDLPQRVWTQARVLWIYVQWILVPDLRSLGFHHDDILASRSLLDPLSSAIALTAWLVAALSAWFLRVRWPLLALALAWFLLAHVIESTVLALELVFEHRNYLASIGPVLLVVGVVNLLAAIARRSLAVIAVVLISMLFAVLLALRAQYWGDELRLAAYHLQNHPASARSIFHFANTSLRKAEREHDPDRQRKHVLVARHYYERMLQAMPHSVVALVSLLYVDEAWFPQAGTRDRWLAELRDAMHKGVFDAQDYNALGMLVDCVNSRICHFDASVIPELLEEARRSGCCRASHLDFHASRFYLGEGDDSRRARDHALAAIESAPDFYPAYLQAIEANVRLEQHAQAAELVGRWLARDALKKRLNSMVSVID